MLLGATGLWGAMSGHFIGAAVAAVGDFLSGPTACAILFVVGDNIEFSRDSLVGAVRAAGAASCCSAHLFRVVCILFLTWTVGMTDLLRSALILLFTLPGPDAVPVFARSEADGALRVLVPVAVHASVGGHVLRHRRTGLSEEANISLIFAEGGAWAFLPFDLWYNGKERLSTGGRDHGRI